MSKTIIFDVNSVNIKFENNNLYVTVPEDHNIVVENKKTKEKTKNKILKNIAQKIIEETNKKGYEKVKNRIYNITTNRFIQYSASNKSRYVFTSFIYEDKEYKITGKEKDLQFINNTNQVKKKKEEDVDLSDIKKEDVINYLSSDNLENINSEKIKKHLDYLLKVYDIGLNYTSEDDTMQLINNGLKNILN